MQQKIPDKDLSRILKGVGLIAVGAGKVTGAVALAAISAPFCGAVVGVAGEAAAGITAAAGGGDIAQGLQEIMCGWNGDSESESYNLVRDTLYSGNETAYQISTVTAAVCGGAGKWLGTRAAKAAEAAAKKAAEEAAGLADETAEAAAKTAAKEAGEVAEEAVKQSTKDALEDAAGETAIGNLDGIEGIGKSGTSSGRTFKSQYEIPTNEKGYTRSSLELGKKVHKEYMSDVADDVNKIKEYVLPSGKRVDFIDFENKIVYELKPNNPNQIKKGTKQLAGYLEEIEIVFGKGWSSVLDTY